MARRDGPLIVQNDRTVLLDVHHPRADEARENLAQFAELVKSPENLHTYRISPISLWNAAAAGIPCEDVVAFLDRFSMLPLPRTLTGQIEEIMSRFGRLLLRRENDRLVLSVSQDLWDRVAALKSLVDFVTEADPERCELVVAEAARGELKRALVRAGFPVEDIAGYLEGDSLDFDLQERLGDGSGFGLRSYQRAAAEAFYQDGDQRGGNGVVVLPCGAGKTVTAMAVMQLYQTKTLVLTNSTTAVRQWLRELRDKTNLPETAIAEYSSEVKEIAPVTVSTYQMITYRSARDGDHPHFTAFMRENWGLVVYDEVHLLPAPVFRMTAELQARRRLGLTATLVREDGREDEVFSLIGPKRYDMPWRRLEGQGFIAEARCVEVRVPFAREDALQYEEAGRRERYRLAAENPLKLRALAALLDRHASDRVLIIGMYLKQLAQIRAMTGIDIITSKTTLADREQLYGDFRQGKITRLIVSKVANFAIDLPDANVAIQVSGTFGSRQEEAQRLGRVLRPKSHDLETIFYTLVTDETREMRFAANRQMFLTEQGYHYEVMNVRSEFAALDWSNSEDLGAEAPCSTKGDGA
ncbi:MAG: DEAD/DEAH box helicase [Planctomycetes bacterium]|nr:DEAD/DEAH box helicase [Planctomycetota bacterium]